MAWFWFHDMHSGGGRKTPFAHVFLEAASRGDAFAEFMRRYDCHPDNVTCECCGPDFSVSEYATLREATAYERNCDCTRDEGWVERAGRFGDYVSLDDYLAARRPGREICVVHLGDRTEAPKGWLPPAAGSGGYAPLSMSAVAAYQSMGLPLPGGRDS